jgi:glycosyltransferase involved in cell wall biosynthesis
LHPKVKIIYNIASILDINGQRFKGLFGKLSFLAMKFVDIILVQTQDQYNLLNKKRQKKVPTDGMIRNIYEYQDNTNKEERKHILWVSRCIKIKRPEIFLSLAKNFPNEKFIMICPKSDIELWNKISQETNKYRNLKFIESVPYKEIGKYFKEAKIFVNTSTHEGYPNTFLQAAETNTPILSLSVNPDKLLDKYKIGLDCKNNYNLMEETLNRLLKDRSLYNRLSQNSEIYLKKEHNKDINFNKLLKILDNI